MSTPPEDPVRGPPVLVEDGAALARWTERVGGASQVALDTEANSLHAYRERTCIVQVTVDGETAILDALALGDLAPLKQALDRPDVEVLFHGGDYDITVLTRDHGFRFDRVFDTMIAATLLGEPKVGLADLVEARYGVALTKRFQKADWAKRPLTPEQVDYLHRDTAYLPGLTDALRQRLRDADLVEEADIEFRRLATRQGQPVGPDPEGWRRIKGAGRLDARGRAILERLHAWREQEAERRDVPTFKVLSPRTMLQVAERAPSLEGKPSALLHPGERRRYGRDVDRTVEEGLHRAGEGNAPPARLGQPPSRDEVIQRKRAREREDRLRAWRREKAAERAVPTIVVLPNPALVWIASELPESVETLGAHPDVGPKRAERYGAEILDVLSKAR